MMQRRRRTRRSALRGVIALMASGGLVLAWAILPVTAGAAVPPRPGNIQTVAGNGTASSTGDFGPATSAAINDPASVALDSVGNLYIAEYFGNRVRKVSPTGVITTYAGNGTAGYAGDGGPATSAGLYAPAGLAVNPAGDLYIADQNNNRVRKVSPTGVITTYAGNGTAGYAGDSGPATSAQLWGPTGVTLDNAGNLYVSEAYNHRVRKVSPTGVITTYAGNGTAGSSGDGGPATAAQLNVPHIVALDSAGDLYIAEHSGQRVRQVNPTGAITTYAGNGIAGYSGDGGPATAAELYAPAGLAVDPAGDLYIADSGNQRVREVAPGAGVVQVVGNSFIRPSDKCNGGQRIIDATTEGVHAKLYTLQPSTTEIDVCVRVEDASGNGYGGEVAITPTVPTVTTTGFGTPSTDTNSTACTTTTNPPNQVPGAHPVSYGGVGPANYLVDAYLSSSAGWVCLQVGPSPAVSERVIVPVGTGTVSVNPGADVTWYPDPGTP